MDKIQVVPTLEKKKDKKAPLEIDYDKLAEAIVKAKKIEKENETLQKEEALKTWRKEIGYNDHEDKQKWQQPVYRFSNRVKVILKVMFISKKKHIAISPTKILLQSIISLFFKVVQWILTIATLCFGILIFYHPNHSYGIVECSRCVILSLFSFILSRIFRLMVIEIDQMDSREQLLGVFTVIVSFFPLIEKAIELFKGVG